MTNCCKFSAARSTACGVGLMLRLCALLADKYKKTVGTDFFEKIRGTSVVSLYNNEMAWAHFGYEGSSYEMGGYFDRGFQDLDWLPDPDADASPAKA